MEKSLFEAQCLTHDFMAGTEGGVWPPSEIILEAPVCLRQGVQE